MWQFQVMYLFFGVGEDPHYRLYWYTWPNLSCQTSVQHHLTSDRFDNTWANGTRGPGVSSLTLPQLGCLIIVTPDTLCIYLLLAAANGHGRRTFLFTWPAVDNSGSTAASMVYIGECPLKTYFRANRRVRALFLLTTLLGNTTVTPYSMLTCEELIFFQLMTFKLRPRRIQTWILFVLRLVCLNWQYFFYSEHMRKTVKWTDQSFLTMLPTGGRVRKGTLDQSMGSDVSTAEKFFVLAIICPLWIKCVIRPGCEFTAKMEHLTSTRAAYSVNYIQDLNDHFRPDTCADAAACNSHYSFIFLLKMSGADSLPRSG